MKNSLKVGDTVTVNAFTAPGQDSTFLFTCTVKKISSGGEYFVANEHEPHFGYNTFKVEDIIPETPKVKKPMKWFLGSVNSCSENFCLSIQGINLKDATERLEKRLNDMGYEIDKGNKHGRGKDTVWFWGYDTQQARESTYKMMPCKAAIGDNMIKDVYYIYLTEIEKMTL